ncbi:MAG: Maleate isomerase [Alphaproteobacteria bacterium MarineAlpha11_Bin1]|nr:MAG: Maleate isomerase [Alphaproteobacteria bacterium MarineAlpha11_Bin1]|tara:strand:+ start:26449 stop:27192 length:744 start_codon:yes stop_codon:yes gene_type:complete
MVVLKNAKPIGWRSKIGVIVPPSNTVNEAEFNRVTPDGVSFHFTRSPLHSDPAADDFTQMLEDVTNAMHDLVACNVNFATYACTAGSMACPSDRLLGKMTEIGNVPANSTAQAIVAALNKLGVEKISMASPYTPETNEHEAHFLSVHGIDVLSTAGLSLNTSLKSIQKISQVPPLDVFNHARLVNHPNAEAVLICCTDFNTFSSIELLENELGKPVLSSNSATLWHSLRNAGIADQINDLGTLLRDH